MVDFVFGDMVTDTFDGGLYMVVSPYTGPRGVNDDQRPAVWIVDIGTSYKHAGEGSTTWIAVEQLEPVDE